MAEGGSGSRSRATKQQMEDRYRRMQSLMDGGASRLAAAKQVADEEGINHQSIYVGYQRWSGSGGQSSSRSTGTRTQSFGYSRESVEDSDIVALMSRRRDALQVQIDAREEELENMRGELAKIERALSVLGNEESGE